MTLFIYNLVLPFYLIFSLPGWWLKMRRRGGYGANFSQRFGLYDKAMRARLSAMDRPWWVHAVSVGEVLIAVKLIDEVLRQNPGQAVILTTTSSTGYATARSRAPESVLILYNPLDLLITARRALDVIRPGQIILTESEIWPNLIAAARRRGIPVCIANARLSPRSARRYARFRKWVAPILGKLTAVFVQEDTDIKGWVAAGVPRERLICVGSIKFDPAAAPAADRDREAFIGEVLQGLWGPLEESVRLVLGSSHAGEEMLAAQWSRDLRKNFPSLRLIVVPRHFERAASIVEALAAERFSVEQRSLWPRRRTAGEPDVLLVDSTGELRSWYAFADIVVIGKSFTGVGGQNPAEPVLAGRPVLFGPHMENFEALTAALVKAGGAIQAPDGETLKAAIAGLLQDSDRRKALAERGRACLERHRGAAARTAEKLLEFAGYSA